VHVPGQGNNAYIFPGVGLAAVVGGLKHITDDMMRVSARSLADMATEEDLASSCLYPALARIREVSAYIALKVTEVPPP
jgi:malate dehydrogenase (oxaloacetate-decarboxylating)(NADP+)